MHGSFRLKGGWGLLKRDGRIAEFRKMAVLIRLSWQTGFFLGSVLRLKETLKPSNLLAAPFDCSKDRQGGHLTFQSDCVRSGRNGTKAFFVPILPENRFDHCLIGCAESKIP